MIFLLCFLLGSSRILTPNKVSTYNTGLDERYNITESISDEIHRVAILLSKKDLLCNLENSKICIAYKVKMINDADLICINNMASKITEGGLYKDWDFTF